MAPRWESAQASAARKAFRVAKNKAGRAILLCRSRCLRVWPSLIRWIFPLLWRWLFLRAFLWPWPRRPISQQQPISSRPPPPHSPAGPFCIEPACPAGMLASIRQACAALAAPFPRPFQNRSEYKFRMYEPYFESATRRTPSQDSTASRIASEYFQSLNGFYVAKGFRRIMEARFGRMMARRLNTRRSFFATLCLVAVVLLYAPLGGAAWFVYSGGCCTSGSECPIHGHHHSQTPSGPEHAMDCGHDMPAVTQCSMSCCHNPDRPGLAPVIFVLPVPIRVSASTSFELLAPLPGSQDSVSSIEPLSPPPRLSSSPA